MYFSKNIFLASVFAASASATSLRSRGLTECPDNAQLTCSVLKDGQTVATSSGASLVLAEFDPSACNEITCEAPGLAQDFAIIKFAYDNGKEHEGYKGPVNLSAKKVNGCAPIEATCEDLQVSVEAWQNVPPGSTTPEDYKCQSQVITCQSKDKEPDSKDGKDPDTKEGKDSKESKSKYWKGWKCAKYSKYTKYWWNKGKY